MDLLILSNNSLTNSYDVLSFERKLVELVEELRLRRNLEIASETNMKSLMDEKYKAELEWDEKQSIYIREKADLEQQITLLKRKLEDKFCVSDDEKAKQHIVNKTYSQEIRALKAELRNSNSEKINLLKRIQELEGKLKLHTNFQETIVSQIADIRKRTKILTDDKQALAKAQKNVLDNVSEAKSKLRKYDISNQHLLQCIAVAERNSEELQKELITTRAEVVLYKTKTESVKRNSEKCDDANKLQEKISELHNLLLFSRKENQKTLQNFVESNKQLNKYINKYANAQEVEKSLSMKLQENEMKTQEVNHRIKELEGELKILKEHIENEDQRRENRNTVETQTCVESADLCDSFFQPADSSQMSDQSEENSKIEKHTSVEILDMGDALPKTNYENTDSFTLEVTNNKTHQPDRPNFTDNFVLEDTDNKIQQPEKCTRVFKMDDEIGVFGEKVKRKFDMIDDEDIEPFPSKKRNKDIETDTSWAMNMVFGERHVANDASIQSSANSVVDCPCHSQDISVAGGNVDSDLVSVVADVSNVEGVEVETSDLVSVQMNLKELKVNDVGVRSSQC